MPRKKTPDFETALSQLEGLVARMEEGDMPLEDALKAFEEGIMLTRTCQSVLDNAEQKVQQLVEANGKLYEQDFDLKQDT